MRSTQSSLPRTSTIRAARPYFALLSTLRPLAIIGDAPPNTEIMNRAMESNATTGNINGKTTRPRRLPPVLSPAAVRIPPTSEIHMCTKQNGKCDIHASKIMPKSFIIFIVFYQIGNSLGQLKHSSWVQDV